MCREEMGDDRFSKAYHKLLKLTQCIGMGKHMKISKNEIHGMLKKMDRMEEDAELMEYIRVKIKNTSKQEIEMFWESGGR